ncbi:MAG TPA: hypothetical protein VLA34_05710, partial [Candidatus Krumholzibacterium sp.]|nr:hypothetical protein [Candidatus Krumholzibacterium sp.]
MLIRIVLMIREKRLEKALREYFVQPDVRIESLGGTKDPFQKALKTSGDIFIASSTMIPAPMDSSLALINDLPETPTTVILHESESPEDQANLIAMGADVVLYRGLDESTLIEAVETTIDSRRNLVGRPLTAGRPIPWMR